MDLAFAPDLGSTNAHCKGSGSRCFHPIQGDAGELPALTFHEPNPETCFRAAEKLAANSWIDSVCPLDIALIICVAIHGHHVHFL